VTATSANVLAKGRAKLAAERARLKRAAEPRAPPANMTWRPTPTRYENNPTAADPANIVMGKVWDTSPIDPSSFDLTPGPSPGPAPVCTTPPQITPLGSLVVGEQPICPNGTSTGAVSYTRQWVRGSSAIPGETTNTYTMVVADLGLFISCTITAANPNGSSSASADAVGPVTPGAPMDLKRR
jgi:hypothetical protein